MSHSSTENNTIPEDILWHIFSELVGPIPEPPFSNTPKPLHPIFLMRVVSQVCSSWRGTAIGAASIWGRLIDIGFLCKQPKWWREEIMGRTKDAPLQVYGELKLPDHGADRAFFSTLISNEWYRVESFTIIAMDPTYSNDATLWDQLWRQEAPSLMVFWLDLAESTIVPFPAGTINNIMFSNYAPSLPTLKVPFELYLPSSTSWLQELITLDIPLSKPFAWISDVLRRTPQLAILRLSEPLWGIEPSSAAIKEEPSTLAPIKMGSLREIDIFCYSTRRLVQLFSILRFQESIFRKCIILCTDTREQDTSGLFNYISFIPSLICGLFQQSPFWPNLLRKPFNCSTRGWYPDIRRKE
ncbi:hypothetical protein CPC08DRAFT_710708 [Agrocybe pediades]|nr:hypothetical protein CPC08DRAFT_710708 [Agrocybe pediades]